VEYHLPSPFAEAVKLQGGGGLYWVVKLFSIMFSSHFLLLIISQHSKAETRWVSCEKVLSKDPFQKDPIIFFFISLNVYKTILSR
jgi:hypothetical protein